MLLRSLQLHPISTSHYYTSGDVTIQAGVAIAPGVLIQADPNSRVVIRSGACIGIGAILHAHDGVVEIGEGANIGAEALLVGHVQVGARACVGAATTIFNSNVDSGQIVPPGSLIEGISHSVNEVMTTNAVVDPESQPANQSVSNESTPPQTNDALPQTNDALPQTNDALSSEEEQSSELNVSGQVYVNRMFFKMFPHHSRSQPVESNGAAHLPQADLWDD